MNAVPDSRHHPDRTLTPSRHAGESRKSVDAAWLLAQYDRLADAPDAVARLRRFVLDLAVRGKLVEQDPSDEPATELASQFSEDDKIEVDAAASDQFPSDLPSGWTTAPLRALVRVLNGRAYKKRELLEEGTPVLRVGNLFTSKKWYYSDLDLDDDKYCTQGDLIFAWSASFGPFIWDGPRAIFHYHIWKLPIRNEAHVDKHFLYQFLLQKTREIKNAGHGISMVHMTKRKMERLLVPLPPLAEQHRIVAKVDELMALCDQLEEARTRRAATRDRLAAASLRRLIAPDTDAATFRDHARFALDHLPALTTRPDQIKVLRQTILDLAVQGDLTEQVDDEILPSDFSDLSQGEAAFGILPKNWRWLPTENICTDIVDCPHSTPKFETVGLLCLDTNSFKGGKLLQAKLRYVSEATYIERIKRIEPKAGDVIFAREGSVGESIVVPDDLHCCLGQRVMLFRPKGEIDPEYFRLAISAPTALKRLLALHKGIGAKHVNVRDMRKNLIPTPPFAEQHRIVAKVDELMALCDQLEASLAKAETTRSRLLEATLREALQSPAHEPDAA